MSNKLRNILLIVEGAKTEVKLFERIIECFPEINLTKDNIIVYNTNIWVLNQNLINEFGKKWYQDEEISFREYVQAQFHEIKGQKITDIFLIFDYERQDPRFDEGALENMCMFFCDSVENGLLYINYPMVEAYKHFNTILPDNGYKERKCSVADISGYKEFVGNETKYQDPRKINRIFLQQAVIHNVKKYHI